MALLTVFPFRSAGWLRFFYRKGGPLRSLKIRQNQQSNTAKEKAARMERPSQKFLLSSD